MHRPTLLPVDRRSVSLDRMCPAAASKDVPDVFDLDSDESSSSAEHKSTDENGAVVADDSSVTMFDDSSSIRSGTDSENNEIVTVNGKNTAPFGTIMRKGAYRGTKGLRKGKYVLHHAAEQNVSSDSSAQESETNEGQVAQTTVQKDNELEKVGCVESVVADRERTGSLSSGEDKPCHRVVLTSTNNGSGSNSPTDIGASSSSNVGDESAHFTQVLDQSLDENVSASHKNGTNALPSIAIDRPLDGDTSNQLEEVDEDVEGLYPGRCPNYVFQLARAFSYRAKKVNSPPKSSFKLSQLFNVPQNNSDSGIESSETSASSGTLSTVLKEDFEDAENAKSAGTSDWNAERSRSASFDDENQSDIAGRRNVRDTVRLFNMHSQSRSIDRLHLNKIAEPSDAAELHADNNRTETDVRRLTTSRSVSVGRRARAPGSLIQERMKVFEGGARVD